MTMRTCVIQSYRTSNVPCWINTCLASVQSWSGLQEFDYQLVGDEIFERVPDWYRQKTIDHPQIATDLGRLHLIDEAFDGGYDRAIWLDADVLVFDPENFAVEQTSGFAFGREIWVQADAQGKPRVFQNVHNAYAIFCQDNAFLSFYRYACEQIISRIDPGPGKGMAPQIVGPKLLTSLHNTLGFDLTDEIAMLSPDVLQDIHGGGGPALDLFLASSTNRPRGVNLCASLAAKVSGDGDSFMDRVCTILLGKPEILEKIGHPTHQGN